MKAKTPYLSGGWTGCNLSVRVHGWLWLYSLPHRFIPESKGLDGAKVRSPPRVHADQNINVTAGTQKAAPHARAATGLFVSLETALSLTQAGRRTTRWATRFGLRRTFRRAGTRLDSTAEASPSAPLQWKLRGGFKEPVCFMLTKIDHFSGKHYHDVTYQQRKNIVRKHFKNMFTII